MQIVNKKNYHCFIKIFTIRHNAKKSLMKFSATNSDIIVVFFEERIMKLVKILRFKKIKNKPN